MVRMLLGFLIQLLSNALGLLVAPLGARHRLPVGKVEQRLSAVLRGIVVHGCHRKERTFILI